MKSLSVLDLFMAGFGLSSLNTVGAIVVAARSFNELDEICSLVEIGRVVCGLFDALVFAGTNRAMDATVILNLCNKTSQLRIECFHVLKAGQVAGRR